MLFGTSGIRGLYGKEITEELAYKVANVFAEKDVALARDTRRTGESLTNAAISGILAAGRNVFDVGIIPTPTLAMATVTYKCLGMMITASHNPEEYNGIKLFREGKEISKEEEKLFMEKFQKGTRLAQWDRLGKLSKHSAIEAHKSMVKKLVDGKSIAKRKPKVIVDSNGAATVITADLLKELGCEVISINDQKLGFARGSEPCVENLVKLKETISKTKADFGIAHDGDGDRCVIVDEQGEILPLDVQLAIMVDSEVKEKQKLISTVEASLLIRETVEGKGGNISIGPVGSTFISHELGKTKAVFGGEPCGEYIFANAEHHAPDGVLAAAKFAEIFAKKGKFSELKKKYKTYFMLREKFRCDKKYEVIQKIIKKITVTGKRSEFDQLTFDQELVKFYKLHDGLRIDEEDGWFLIRASGTEPIIRLTMEYKDKGKLEKRAKELIGIITQTL